MRTVSALDVRRRFGEVVDQAAAGERIVIERAGQPVAAIVPLSDLAEIDPDRRRGLRLAALEEIRRSARRRGRPAGFDAAGTVRAQRDARTVASPRIDPQP